MNPTKRKCGATIQSNVAILQQYPYIWGSVCQSFEGLTIKLFPLSDEVFYCYDHKADNFWGSYDAQKGANKPYFFADLKDPILCEHEDNIYNLTYLNDVVRDSAAVAMENHIYLRYSDPEPLERLMLVCSLEDVLAQEKFVLLIGKENAGRYPLDLLELDEAALEAYVEQLKGWGLQGMECYYSKNSPSWTESSLAIARRQQLWITGGSDFHDGKTRRNVQIGTGCAHDWDNPKHSVIEQIKAATYWGRHL